ncbi:hypothetical protein [Caudoviricetes sp.]|nr:hypothetical protein [Caudoviricetes sp.]
MSELVIRIDAEGKLQLEWKSLNYPTALVMLEGAKDVLKQHFCTQQKAPLVQAVAANGVLRNC